MYLARLPPPLLAVEGVPFRYALPRSLINIIAVSESGGGAVALAASFDAASSGAPPPAWLALSLDPAAGSDAALTGWALSGTPSRADVTLGPQGCAPLPGGCPPLSLAVLISAQCTVAAAAAATSASVPLALKVARANAPPFFIAAGIAISAPVAVSTRAGKLGALTLRNGVDFGDSDAPWGDRITVSVAAAAAWVQGVREEWEMPAAAAVAGAGAATSTGSGWVNSWTILLAPAAGDVGTVASLTITLTDAAGATASHLVIVTAIANASGAGGALAGGSGGGSGDAWLSFQPSYSGVFGNFIACNATEHVPFAYTLPSAAFVAAGGAAAPSSYAAQILQPTGVGGGDCGWLRVAASAQLAGAATSAAPSLPSLLGTPGTADKGGVCSVLVTASNSDGDVASGVVRVVVQRVNDPPSVRAGAAAALAPIALRVGQLFVGLALPPPALLFADTDLPFGDSLTLSLSVSAAAKGGGGGAPAWVGLACSAALSVSNAASATCSLAGEAPSGAAIAAPSFFIVATDLGGFSASIFQQVVILPAPLQPVIAVGEWR